MMKTLLRALVLLLVVIWIGGESFFPVIAWASFSTLHDKHAAGTIVALCLRVLHTEGLVAGLLLLALLAIAGPLRAYGRAVIGPIAVTLVMLALTVLSQFSIIPRMEVDRAAVGGSIDGASPGDPHRVDFERLHVASTRVEGGILVAGLLLVVMLARTPPSKLRS